VPDAYSIPFGRFPGFPHRLQTLCRKITYFYPRVTQNFCPSPLLRKAYLANPCGRKDLNPHLITLEGNIDVYRILEPASKLTAKILPSWPENTEFTVFIYLESYRIKNKDRLHDQAL
jgi:hypothetical protein